MPNTEKVVATNTENIKNNTEKNTNATKPLSLVREDFIKEIVKIISTTPLPPFVMESVLRDIYNSVNSLAKQALEEDRKNYNKQNNA